MNGGVRGDVLVLLLWLLLVICLLVSISRGTHVYVYACTNKARFISFLIYVNICIFEHGAKWKCVKMSPWPAQWEIPFCDGIHRWTSSASTRVHDSTVSHIFWRTFLIAAQCFLIFAGRFFKVSAALSAICLSHCRTTVGSYKWLMLKLVDRSFSTPREIADLTRKQPLDDDTTHGWCQCFSCYVDNSQI